MENNGMWGFTLGSTRGAKNTHGFYEGHDLNIELVYIYVGLQDGIFLGALLAPFCSVLKVWLFDRLT